MTNNNYYRIVFLRFFVSFRFVSSPILFHLKKNGKRILFQRHPYILALTHIFMQMHTQNRSIIIYGAKPVYPLIYLLLIVIVLVYFVFILETRNHIAVNFYYNMSIYYIMFTIYLLNNLSNLIIFTIPKYGKTVIIIVCIVFYGLL